MPDVHCHLCDKLFDPEQSRAMPFCSERCRLLDLGRWLDERYGLSGEQEEEQPSSARDRAEEP